MNNAGERVLYSWTPGSDSDQGVLAVRSVGLASCDCKSIPLLCFVTCVGVKGKRWIWRSGRAIELFKEHIKLLFVCSVGDIPF